MKRVTLLKEVKKRQSASENEREPWTGVCTMREESFRTCEGSKHSRGFALISTNQTCRALSEGGVR